MTEGIAWFAIISLSNAFTGPWADKLMRGLNSMIAEA
jgi:hypothetical protein